VEVVRELDRVLRITAALDDGIGQVKLRSRGLTAGQVLLRVTPSAATVEPTNDMDTDMLAAIEDLLDSRPGTLRRDGEDHGVFRHRHCATAYPEDFAPGVCRRAATGVRTRRW